MRERLDPVSLRIALTSASVLVGELILIRWVPANVVYVGFFNNFLLIASFLGIGLGVLVGRRFAALAVYAPIPLLALVVVVLGARLNAFFPNAEIFLGQSRGALLAPAVAVLALVVALTALATLALALPLGPLLRRLPPLRAYASDIAGSIAGIALFAALSFANTPPPAWFAVLFALVGAVHLRGGRTRVLIGAGAMAAVLLLTLADVTPGRMWSPYYRIDLYRYRGSDIEAIAVNGIPHQDLSPAVPKASHPFYDQIYDWLPSRRFDDVLVVGAGAGNDTAVALAHGVGHVDAVEIDPLILEIGMERHPDRPYGDPRVRTVVADGRAYLRTTDRSYDLIVFAQTDSLTLVTSTADLRLESFLFTEEAFASARDRLRADGVLVLYNFYREPWLVERYASMLERVFGAAPLVRTYPELGAARSVLFAAAKAPGALGRPADAERVDTSAAPRPATDDWPFPYLPAPGIASYYLFALTALVVFALLLAAAASRVTGRGTFRPVFFLLGAAFLLLETKSIATFSLLFGTTWYVNALVFAAILASVLLAILAAARMRRRAPALRYGGLFGSLALAYLLPPTAVLLEPAWLRYAAASVVAFAPVFFANIVFAAEFADVDEADAAFGWNLLGAVCGGALEYLAMSYGYQQLLLAAATLYAIAAIAVSRSPAVRPIGMLRQPE